MLATDSEGRAQGREAADLRAKLDALKASLVVSVADQRFPWPLSPIERQIFGMLLAQDIVTKRTIVLLVHDREPSSSDLKNIDVFISRIRSKTLAKGVAIETIFGVGYRLLDRDNWRNILLNGAEARH